MASGSRKPRTLPVRPPKDGLLILQRLVEGERLDSISVALGYSKSWGATTLERMRLAFGAQNNEQLVAIAMRRGLIA